MGMRYLPVTFMEGAKCGVQNASLDRGFFRRASTVDMQPSSEIERPCVVRMLDQRQILHSLPIGSFAKQPFSMILYGESDSCVALPIMLYLHTF